MRVWVMVCALLAAAPAGAAARSWHLAVVQSTAVRSIKAAEAAQLPAGAPVWVWSDHCAPERLVAPLPAQLPCADGAKLTVRALGKDRRPLAGVRVLAAPRTMLAEVPDALLPSAPTDAKGVAVLYLPPGSEVAVRLASADGATLWRSVRPGGSPLTLMAAPAAPLGVRVIPAGAQDQTVWIQYVGAGPAGGGGPLAWAVGRIDALELPPLPAGLPVTVVAWGERSAPAAVHGVTGSLPKALRLPPGAGIAGRVVDGAGHAVAGVALRAAFALPGLQQGRARRAISGADGSFILEGLPRNSVVVNVSREGFVPEVRELDLSRDGGATLNLVLRRGRRVAVVVHDTTGNPVAGAEIALQDGPTLGRTGADGRAVLAAVPAGAVLLAVTARGFLPGRLKVPKQADAPLDLTLDRAAGVTARFVFADTGDPAGPGRVRWESRSGREWAAVLPDSGELEEVNLQPGTWSLGVAPDGAVPVRWKALALAGGEPLDLGEVRVQRGLAVAGVVFDDVTGAPVADAQARTLRPDPSGPRFAALQKEWINAVTDQEGRFRLEGLEAGVYALLITAPGHAPRLIERLKVSEDVPEGVLRLDPLWLGEPHRLKVRCTPAKRCGNEAVLLLGSPLAEWASVGAGLAHGSALIEPVPTGHRTLRLLDGGWVVTEREVNVADDEDTTEVEISLAGTRVTGEVTLGGAPASGGTVMLAPGGGAGGIPEIDVRTRLPGQDQSKGRVLTSRGRPVNATVDAAGRFEAEDVPAGRYEVTYWSPDGWKSAARTVEIAESEEQHLVLAYQAGTLTGRVVTPEGKPVGAAMVWADDAAGRRAGGAVGPDGTFRLGGLAPGPATVGARGPDGEAEADVEIQPDEPAEVELVLKPHGDGLDVTVTGPEGTPVAGAMVMALGPAGGALQTTDAEGRVSFQGLGEGSAVALAAFRAGLGFTFGRGDPEAGEAILAFFAETGTLAMEASGPMRALTMAAPEGFPLEKLLPMLGLPPAVGAEAPLELSGLPPGAYTVGLVGGAPQQVWVRAGERTEVQLGK